ncbi:PaaI family thioesterase [Lacisediminimonas profundi]|uniref:PaaI family thioesterase n=1 Tax=Lacisediminimonas profundi TaxID=2603856 RepID=UPI00124B5F23|nr:PaaI family thioesterase [Lacisediminimonas profundi]
MEPHTEPDNDAAVSDQGATHFGALLGFQHRAAESDTAILELTLRPSHCNKYGTVHGGVLMAMLDAAGLWAGAPQDGSLPQGVTAALNCNFLRGARFGDAISLRAEGRIAKRGRSMYFSSITVTAMPGDVLLASAQGVFSTPQAHPNA